MEIVEKTVANVVAEASEKMSEHNYSAVLVGDFVQTQGAAAQYVGAQAQDMGGAESVVHCIFHAALIAECFKRGTNRTVPELSFAELDNAATDDRRERLQQRQPAILGYIDANVENQHMRAVLELLACAMDWVS